MKSMISIIRLLPRAPDTKRNGMNFTRSIRRILKRRPVNSLVFKRRDSLKDGRNACLFTLRNPSIDLRSDEYRKDDAVASRKLSEICLTKLVAAIPELVGGSADLTGSNLTRWKGAVDFQPVTSPCPFLTVVAQHQTR